MLKGNDLKIFISLIIIFTVFGTFSFDAKFDGYSDLITFLSIIIGFTITSLSILFNSPLKKAMYDRLNPEYLTELHRLGAYYKFSLCFEVISIFILFIFPDVSTTINFKNIAVHVGKFLLVLPIVGGSIYCFMKVVNDLLKIFVYPTNEKAQ